MSGLLEVVILPPVTLLSLLPLDISRAKHSFSSANTSLMSGLWIAAVGTHDMAISTAFQAELVWNSTCNLGSTVLNIPTFNYRINPVNYVNVFFRFSYYCWAAGDKFKQNNTKTINITFSVHISRSLKSVCKTQVIY